MHFIVDYLKHRVVMRVDGRFGELPEEKSFNLLSGGKFPKSVNHLLKTWYEREYLRR